MNARLLICLLLPLVAHAQTVGDKLRANASRAAAITVSGPPITLTWNASPSTEAIGYKVYWGTTNGVYASHVDVGTNLIAQITGLAIGQRYYFAATAYRSARRILARRFYQVRHPASWKASFRMFSASSHDMVSS